jgi:hypothetical protein
MHQATAKGHRNFALFGTEMSVAILIGLRDQCKQKMPGSSKWDDLQPWRTFATGESGSSRCVLLNVASYKSGHYFLAALMVERAIQLLTFLEWDDLPVPQIGPVPGGGIQIEWHVAERELAIEVLPNGSVEFLPVEGEAMNEGPLSMR